MMAVEVMGLVIDATQKIVSVGPLGRSFLMSPPDGRKMQDVRVIRHQRHRAGELALIDERLHGLIDPGRPRTLHRLGGILIRHTTLKSHS